MEKTVIRKKPATKLPHCKLLVVMPVGPDDNGKDTIESIFTYCTSSVIILAIDDSKNEATATYLKTVDPRVICLPSGNFRKPLRRGPHLPSAKYKGIRGEVFCNLARAYRYAVDHYSFDMLLRIDTDALIIGPHPEDDALEAFHDDPKIGMLGFYRYDDAGSPRDFGIVGQGMFRETSLLGLRNQPRRKRLNYWIKTAKLYGYDLGEHCLGAVVYQNAATIRAFARSGDLFVDEFRDSVISEDHLFSLLTIRHGYKLADFATGSLPMGVQWRGLPDSPENLVKRGKKIIHSIKFYKDMSEQEIRVYFRKLRAKQAKAKPAKATK